MKTYVIVKTHELALKGNNRPWFMRRLLDNLRAATKGTGVERVWQGQMLVGLTLSDEDAWPEVRDRVRDCLGVANRAFVNDRLHRDPLVPDWVADKIRSQWVLNNLESRGDASFVVSDDDGVAGFNLCLMDGGDAVIDLIAVDTGRQKKGFGRALVNGALGHYRGKAETMRVGTQADNEPSIALYRGTGFVEVKRQVTLHWINPDEESAPKPEEDAP